jgi:formylglycine-generating enzyme required for sulfatase activity
MHVSKTIMLTVLVISVTMLAGTSHAEESLIPKEMVYVSHGPSVMGIDKEEPADLGRTLTAYDRRMKTPWSAEALNDEGPAHTVFLDSYLIDKYEVSNKDYGDFIRTKGHPAPAYWG